MEAITGQANNFRFVVRYAAGANIMVAFAMAFNWKLGFLLPVLGLGFLGSGENAPSLQQGLVFVITISFASLTGLFLSYAFLSIPIIHILVTFLLLFQVFYTNSKWIGPNVKVWLIIAVLLIPNMALMSPDFAGLIAVGLIFYALMAILLVWFIFLVVPFKGRFKDPEQVAQTKAPDKQQRYTYAITSTMVIMPMYFKGILSDHIGH